MYLVCGFFGLVGVFSVSTGIPSFVRRRGIQGGLPESVRLFVTVFPIFLRLMGIFALVVAVTLWRARPVGLTGGLVWTGLWLAEELVIGLWALTGPELVQQVSSGVGGTLLRLVVGTAILYYRWTVGPAYVDGDPATPRPSTLS